MKFLILSRFFNHIYNSLSLSIYIYKIPDCASVLEVGIRRGQSCFAIFFVSLAPRPSVGLKRQKEKILGAVFVAILLLSVTFTIDILEESKWVKKN